MERLQMDGENEWRDYLKNYFYNIKNPGALSSPKKLHYILRKQGVKITLAQIKEFLRGQDAYSLHKFVKDPNHGVTRVVPLFLDSHWQIDLASFQNIQQFNKSMNYMLFCIDVLSRYLWVRPIKKKTHQDVLNAFKDILKKSGRKCQVVVCDNGKEFKNQFFKKFCAEEGIYFYSSNTDKKAQIVERVIQTYKNLLYKYFSFKNTFHYLDIYQDLADNYNNSPHRSLNKLSPAEVNEKNQSIIWKKIYVDIYDDKKFKKKLKNNTEIIFNFKVGDFVRISLEKKGFIRSYQQKWSEEIFLIKSRAPFKGIPSYKLTDLKKEEEIIGVFYESELQKIDKDKNVKFTIDKILKYRKLKGKAREAKVSWVGWESPKWDSWIFASSIKNHDSQ